MGWTFRKRIKVLPGITLNASKSGISTTMGPKGARVTVGGKRGPRVSTSIPGTGISYSQTIAKGRRIAASPPRKPVGSRVFVLLLVLLGTIALSLLGSALIAR